MKTLYPPNPCQSFNEWQEYLRKELRNINKQQSKSFIDLRK